MLERRHPFQRSRGRSQLPAVHTYSGSHAHAAAVQQNHAPLTEDAAKISSSHKNRQSCLLNPAGAARVYSTVAGQLD